MKKLLAGILLAWIKFWAKTALFLHKPTTVGIAGSVGKSSTRNAVYCVLKDNGKTKMVSGNSETGVPLGILGIHLENYSFFDWFFLLIAAPIKVFSTIGYKYMVVEMGIDDPYPPKNMGYLLTIIKPDISVDLNATATHTMRFEKLLKNKPDGVSDLEFLIQKIADEDTKIITIAKPKIGIYNGDDKYLKRALEDYRGPLWDFGIKSKDFEYSKYEVDTSGTIFGYKIQGVELDVEIKDQVLPLVYREVFAAAILACYACGIHPLKAAESLTEKYKLPNGRSSILKGKNGSIIIDSSYNSSSDAVITFLDLLKRLASNEKRKALFLMGDMRELGREAEVEHRKVVRKINETVDVLYCVGSLTNEYVIPYVDVKKYWDKNAVLAARAILETAPPKSIILVKGSQNEIFLEEAVKLLLENPNDSKHLCRQGKYWEKLKNEFFKSSFL